MTDEYPLLDIELFERAAEFREAYKVLPRTDWPPNWPRYFLFCHGIELVLKAYITRADRKITLVDLKNYGHDLTKLYGKAVDLGLRPSNPETQSAIQALTEAHLKHWPRYPPLTGPVYMIEQFEPVAADLFEAVEGKR
jgi:hypothetical protein